jgi:hypothetical protein
MKKYLVLMLLSAFAFGCHNSKGDSSPPKKEAQAAVKTASIESASLNPLEPMAMATLLPVEAEAARSLNGAAVASSASPAESEVFGIDDECICTYCQSRRSCYSDPKCRSASLQSLKINRMKNSK